MASLQALTGYLESFFVPAAVIQQQKETQIDLQARAQKLNSNVPETLATAMSGGVLSDGQAKSALQQMNMSLYLVDDSERALTEKIIGDVLDSAANAPSTAINYANDQIVQPVAKTAGGVIKAIVPWQLWLIVGLGVVVAIGIFSYVKAKTV